MDVNPIHNLEYDLMNNDCIVTKCKTSDIYSQNLYAAMCNNRFFYGTSEWSCSWRMSGGIVADLVDANGDYITLVNMTGEFYDNIWTYIDNYYITHLVGREIFVDTHLITESSFII